MTELINELTIDGAFKQATAIWSSQQEGAIASLPASGCV